MLCLGSNAANVLRHATGGGGRSARRTPTKTACGRRGGARRAEDGRERVIQARGRYREAGAARGSVAPRASGPELPACKGEGASARPRGSPGSPGQPGPRAGGPAKRTQRSPRAAKARGAQAGGDSRRKGSNVILVLKGGAGPARAHPLRVQQAGRGRCPGCARPRPRSRAAAAEGGGGGYAA
ncbi:MAG: hypothetical protein J3K34DRAFT_139815 [Monoraphidium minutum]|nr:MAG: hypothetical protein J3K34DRAFT_139815 [Monoraphidium minutum]